MNIRALFLSLSALVAAQVHAATFTVTNTTESGPGSLRQAILDANASPNSPANTPDIINFNIPGAGVKTISPTTPLPNITQAVTIDGYSQPGSSANTLAFGSNAVILIQLDGADRSGFANGLSVTGGGATIRGLVINSFIGSGIRLEGTGDSKIEGCFIGTDTNGSAALGNNTNGVDVVNAATAIIGGTSAGARNVISSNSVGVFLTSTGPSVVQGNYIGTDATGTENLGNFSVGIFINGSDNNLIGGTASGAGNVISGHSSVGIQIGGNTNTLQGNFIGTNAAGTAAIPNGKGVEFTGFTTNNDNLIGGTTATARNVISGNNSQGVDINTFVAINNSVQGNFIGTQANGTSALGNTGEGIRVNSGDNHNIGGTAPGAGNVIAFNGGNGVSVFTSTGSAIRGNAIHDNGKLGIDLFDGGGANLGTVTPNDEGDADVGPNNRQNFPVLQSVTTSGGNTTITGTLNSIPNQTYQIEFFSNGSIDPSGHGEGDSFLGSQSVVTAADGNISFSKIIPAVPTGRRVTATATNVDGNTSEFSPAIGQLVNIASRLRVQTGDNVLIGGFIVTGTDPKNVLVRGIGPSLAGFFPDFLADPTLDLFQGNTSVATNDNWKTRPDGSSQQAEIEATTIPPSNDLEAALVRTLPANGTGYTAIVRGKDNTTGTGVVELYDLDTAANSKLANISTRGLVETGDDVLIGGFIPGNGVTKVIIRAIGPTLVNAGVSDPLLDPTLELFDASGTSLALNDDWKTTQRAEIEATTIPPNDDRESAIVASLPPGNYTAVVRGKDNTIGIAVVEVYNIQ